jgi:hypothetical protein
MNDRILTVQEHRDREQLAKWMAENGVNVKLLADATGVSSNYIYMMTKSDRTISEAFKWRFGVAYGHEVAQRVFAEPLRELA